MHKSEGLVEVIVSDIERINEILVTAEKSDLTKLHKQIDGRYHTRVKNWVGDMYGYNNNYGFNYELLGEDSLKDNLENMRGKLEGYLIDLDAFDALRMIEKGETIETDANEAEDKTYKDESCNSSHGEKKLFISHSHADVSYVKAIVDLLESIGLPENAIVCSSVAPYCIPLNEEIYEWLADRFRKDKLWVLFILSKDYYRSVACLNEMGATWVTKSEHTEILLPGFDYNEVAGCISSHQIGIKLDSGDKSNLKYMIGELKDNLIKEFGLKQINSAKWERIRDEFIEHVLSIKTAQIPKETTNEISIDNENEMLSHNAKVALVFAAESSGEIISASYITGKSIEIGNLNVINYNAPPREVARWESILSELESAGVVERHGRNGSILRVTDKGYKEADRYMDELKIIVTSDIKNYLRK